MAQVFVRSFPQPGFNGVFTPGRFWPADGLLVEVAKTAADPEPDPNGPVTIGKDTLQLLQSDKRFAVGVPPEDVHKFEELAAQHAEVSAERDALKARVEELEAAYPNKGSKK